MKTKAKTKNAGPTFRLLHKKSWQSGQDLGHEAMYVTSTDLRVRVHVETDTSYHSQSEARADVYDVHSNAWHTVAKLPTPFITRRHQLYVCDYKGGPAKDDNEKIAELAATVDWSADVDQLLAQVALALGLEVTP